MVFVSEQALVLLVNHALELSDERATLMVTDIP
jgi:hypothetical protein